jgi:curved DNA-binding protein CbpA/CheY-like chemotaxis protein
VPRILVVDSHERTLRILQSTLAPLGYQMLALEDVERLRLEMRDAAPDLILVSADHNDGAGLDIVQDAYAETAEPVPVLAWSTYHTPDALKELAPVGLKLGGLLGAPLDPGELVRMVVMLVPPPDPAQAVAFIADLAADASPAGARQPEPDGTYDLSRVRASHLFTAVDHHDWSGAIELHLSATDSITFWFEMGQLSFTRTRRGRDLVQTAIEEERVRGTMVPDVPLQNLEEEAGLLMALRAIGMHEREGLERRTAVRLMAQVLLAKRGRAVARPEEEAEDEFSNPIAIVPLVLEALAANLAESGGLEAHPESVVVVRLPPPEDLESWALGPLQRRVVSQLAKAHNREISLDQFRRVTSAEVGDADVVEATLRLLQVLGYVQFCGRPFPAETTVRLDEFVSTLHRFARSDHFGVLGVKPSADGKEMRRALRDLSKTYHPDTTFGEHTRVEETANALYARIQEAWEVLRNDDGRKAYADQRKAKPKEEKRGNPERAKVALVQGKAFLRSKRYDEAKGAFRDAKLEDPNNRDAKVLHAWAMYLAEPDKPRKATNELKRLINDDRKFADAWFYLGRVTLLLKEDEKARKYFAQAVEASPTHADAARELQRLDRRAGTSSGATERKDKPKGLLARFRRGD